MATATFHDPRQAAGLERVLSNMTENCRMAEAKLASASRELVEALGALKKTEQSLRKLSGNPTLAQRVIALTEAVQSLRKEEAVAQRLVDSQRDGIARFLAEGSPSNGEMIRTTRELEQAEREAGL
jgi:anion-transporting  ArsA/GET3 family ATPase